MEKYFSASTKKNSRVKPTNSVSLSQAQNNKNLHSFDIKSGETFTIATYNILYPSHNKVQRYLMRHETRYRYQMDEVLPNLGADTIYNAKCIIVLNEVTHFYYALLMSKKHITDQYYISPLYRDVGLNSIILSKYPFVELGKAHRSKCHLPENIGEDFGAKCSIINSKTVLALFTVNLSKRDFSYDEHKDNINDDIETEVNFVVVGTHFCSGEDNLHIREREFDKLMNIIDELPEFTESRKQQEKVKNAIENNNVIILGDFNFHLPCENKHLKKYKFNDLWLERYSHFDGITWDPCRNSMINVMLPFDNRRMRLDRICLKDSKQIALESMNIYGDKPVEGCCYLFPSDHFGLKATLHFDQRGLNAKYNHYKDEFYSLPQYETGFRKIKTIVVYRVVSLSLAILCICAFLFLMAMLIWKLFS